MGAYAWCLEGMAEVVGAAKQADHAGRLWGTAGVFHAANGVPLPGLFYAAYDRYRAMTGIDLDAATFATGLVDGWAMTPEQAITYAVDVPNHVGG